MPQPTRVLLLFEEISYIMVDQIKTTLLDLSLKKLYHNCSNFDLDNTYVLAVQARQKTFIRSCFYAYTNYKSEATYFLENKTLRNIDMLEAIESSTIMQ